MIQQLQITYENYRGSKIITTLILLLCTLLLYRLADGFPPRLWLLLFQVLPTLPLLWQLRGITLVPPLLGLLLLSFSLFLLWSLLIGVLLRISLHWWRELVGTRFIAPTSQADSQDGNLHATGNGRHECGPYDVQPRTVGARFIAPQFIAPTTAYVDHWLSDRRSNDPFLSQQHHADEGDNDDNVQLFDLTNAQTLPYGSPAEATSTAAVAVQTRVLQLRVAAVSDPGIVRKQKPNEDSILAVHAKYAPDTEPLLLGVFAVADGMGGHHNGQEASRIAVESLRNTLLPSLSNEQRAEKPCVDLLQQCIHRANSAVYQRQQEQQQMMGTTITAALVYGLTAYIVNVGDSRTYLYRGADGLRQITHDHSLVADLVREGAITRADMYTHPRRNEIYRCLGDGPDVELDAFKVPLQEGDILLLCSDGLWEMVYDEDIEQIIAGTAPHASQLSTQLIQAALNRGGKDNVSVVTVCVTPHNP